jgi:hypothetical protein
MILAARMYRRLAAVMSALVLALLQARAALSQSPLPTPMRAMDPRGGAQASMSGDAILAAVGVVAIGIIAMGATMLWVRVARSHRR